MAAGREAALDARRAESHRAARGTFQTYATMSTIASSALAGARAPTNRAATRRAKTTTTTTINATSATSAPRATKATTRRRALVVRHGAADNNNSTRGGDDVMVGPIPVVEIPTPRDDLPEVLVAGGGIAGLITALAMQRKGMKVKVFEKVKEYKLFGGPIQLQCNAQGALDSIAPDVAEKVLAKSTITGDRINGLLDGVAGDWFYRFDTRQPCYNNGLPLTLVIARYDLLEILRDAVGEENIMMQTVVEKYENVGDKGAFYTKVFHPSLGFNT